MVWLTHFLSLVPPWGASQPFGLGCKSDGFYLKKVPKLCGLWMDRFALGRLAHNMNQNLYYITGMLHHIAPCASA